MPRTATSKGNRTATKSKDVLERWRELKEKQPDTLLGLRVGSFLEFLDGDAELVSKALGIVLTKRRGISMCGVPAGWQGNQRIKILRERGFRVRVVVHSLDTSGDECRPLTRKEIENLEASMRAAKPMPGKRLASECICVACGKPIFGPAWTSLRIGNGVGPLHLSEECERRASVIYHVSKIRDHEHELRLLGVDPTLARDGCGVPPTSGGHHALPTE